MPDVPQSLDNWPATIVAILAAIAAFLVPFTSFVKTVLDYRQEARKSEPLKSETARDVAQCSGGAVFDSMALSDLAAAVKDLAAAIRADTASDEAHYSSKLAMAIERFSERMDRYDAEAVGPRPRHR